MSSPPILLYRFGRFFYVLGVPIIPKIITYANRIMFGCWLPCSANLGRGVKLGYWGLGVVIHADAIIGDFTLISQNVTIGRAKKDLGVPELEAYVYVAPNVVVSGKIVVGRGSMIGANSFVNTSIGEGKLFFGCPAKYVRSVDISEAAEAIGMENF